MSDEKSPSPTVTVPARNMAKRKRGSEMAEMAEMERIFNGICKHHVNKRSDLSSSEAKVNCNDRPCNCGMLAVLLSRVLNPASHPIAARTGHRKPPR